MKMFKLIHIPTLRSCSMIGCMYINEEFKSFIDHYYLNNVKASWIGWHDDQEGIFFMSRHQLYDNSIKVNKHEFVWVDIEDEV